MICVGFRGGRGVLLEAFSSLKGGGAGGRRSLSAFVRGPVRVDRVRGTVGLSASVVRGLFSKPPTGTQGLPKDVKQQNRTTLVSSKTSVLQNPEISFLALSSVCRYWYYRIIICSSAFIQVWTKHSIYSIPYYFLPFPGFSVSLQALEEQSRKAMMSQRYKSG